MDTVITILKVQLYEYTAVLKLDISMDGEKGTYSFQIGYIFAYDIYEFIILLVELL